MTKSELAYERISAMITSSDLPDDHVISENALAQMLSMSRTPVRDAVRQLAGEGYVDVVRGVGIRVLPVAAQQIYELYPIRCLLECYAMRCSVGRIPKKKINSLIQSWKLLRARVSAGEPYTPQEVYALDAKTHALFIEHAGNATLRQMIKQMEIKIRRYQVLSARRLGDASETAYEHIAILERMRDGNVEEACRLVDEHMYQPWKTVFGREGQWSDSGK